MYILRPIHLLAILGLAMGNQGCTQSPGAARAARTTAKPSFAAFLTMESQAGTQPTPSLECNQQCQKFRQEFRYVVYVGKQIYCYWDQKRAETGLDFDALANQLEQSITSTTSVTEYFVTLRTWASSFHDGHVNAMLGDDQSEIELYTAPVRLEVLAPASDHEKVVVVEAKADMGLTVGDEVLAINGLPVKAAIDQAVLQTSGSTLRMRRFFAARKLVDVMGTVKGTEPLELEVARGTSRLKVALERTAEIMPVPSGPHAEPVAKSGAELIKAMILPGGVGYLRIDGFSGSQSFALLAQAMQRLSATKGLLLDLRKNGGGDQSGNNIIAQLIKAPVTRYRTSERMADYILANRPGNHFLAWTLGNAFADWHDLLVKPKEGSTYVGKPVVALTSPNCFSACDTFAAALKANGLATMVGEGSGGGTGTPLVFDLPNSSNRFRYSVVRGLTAKGDAIEGVGTTPDVVIEPTLSDRGAAKDVQLARALEILGEKISTSKPSGQLPFETVARLVTNAFTPVWTQSLDRSPTLSDEQFLRSIAASDELGQ